MPLSPSPVSGLIFRPKGFIQQPVGVAAADLLLIPGAGHVTVVSDQTMFLGLDRDAVVPGIGVVEDDLLFLASGASRTIYIGDVSRLSAIATVAGTLYMQEVLGV